MLHAGMASAFGDGLIKLVVALRRAERCDVAHAETADGFGGELKFRDRHQVEPAHVQKRALGLGINARIDSRESPKKSNRTGWSSPAGNRIEDAAANGVFAGFADVDERL